MTGIFCSSSLFSRLAEGGGNSTIVLLRSTTFYEFQMV